MALKLGKCRLCLKLGDFFSIFTVDNALQLAEMAMECARVKIYEGDGLPDKVCSECIQKLSSAYIFKQQCERADQELRRNYVPPPGFSVSPPSPNRQSSDSAFSNHTNTSNLTKPPSFIEEKVSPASRTRKRSLESVGAASTADSDYQPTVSKRVEELRKTQKRTKREAPVVNNSQLDSDFDDNSMSFASENDSDEPLSNSFACKQCPKRYLTYRSLAIHLKTHSINTPIKKIEQVSQNNVDAVDVEDKLCCDKCDKTFKLKIMLKRHQDICGKTPIKSPEKQLLVSLEPIDGKIDSRKINCEMCTAKFKTMDNLEKHMKICHAAVLKRNDLEPNPKVPVPCLYCGEVFNDYYIHSAHFSVCPQKDDSIPFECPVCKRLTSRKTSYFQHIRNMHFEPRAPFKKSIDPESEESHVCRMCNKQLASQDLLIKHLAVHMNNIEDNDNGADNESRASTMDDSMSVQSTGSAPNTPASLNCSTCDKEFKYKKALQTHQQKCQSVPPVSVKLKAEPPDKASTSLLSETFAPGQDYDKSDSDSSQEEDNTCDICEKHFSYRRLLLHHKKTKHNMSSGTKRAKIYLKDCAVRCLICDLDMKVSAINEHNQKHISMNMKPRNLYTCAECEDTFKSCSGLATHIKLIHRLNQKKLDNLPNPADFCEVVVTKSEPLESLQSHNDFGEVPGNQEGKPLVDLNGFTCPICSKKMPTLISLKRHVNWHSNVGKNVEKRHECFVCKEVFKFQCHYKIHMRVHYTDPNLDPKHLTCDTCGRRSKHLRAALAHLNFHKQTRFQAKDYQCSICERVFQFRKVYLSHMAVHYKRGDSHDSVVGDLPSGSTAAIAGSHSCHLCGKLCDSENSLKHHLIWHTSKTFLYGARHECHLCKMKFTNKRRLDYHIREHYEDDAGPYKCTICGKGYTDENYFQRHVKGHNFDHQSHKKRIEKLRKGKVKCPICSRFYPDVVKLIRHLRRTHPESKMIKTDPDAPERPLYPCKLCARVFLEEKRLKHHEEAHLRKPEFFKCKFCGKKTISLKNHNVHIKGHLTQKYFENPLKCAHCEEKFIKGYDLHHHLRDVHDITETWIADPADQPLGGPLKDLQCSICMKVLASKGNYERHIDYHNSLRCNYCFDYFSSLRFLEGHLSFSCEKKKLLGDTEVYPKKVKCHVCYKAFHVQVKLDCHLRTQHKIKVDREISAEKKEIVCDYCFKVFENEYALSTHKIYHRTIGYFGCIYCSRKFNTMTLYRKHKNHHFSQLNVDNPTKCEHCDETFVPFREMIYHMRDVHGDDKEWIVMPKESIEETCQICNKTFFNLHKHLDYHEENKCKKCGEYFFSVADFDNHLCSIESDDEITSTSGPEAPKYEECQFCFKAFTRAGSKLKHDQIHRGSGSISCRFCPLKFKTMDAFNIHAFSHRSRKYVKKPIKCRICGEKFIKYGPFVKHMKLVHKCVKKMHYRAVVKPERCVVCGDEFPNLHNHYRAHLFHQCQQCQKYFTSAKVFAKHQCDKDDSDPSKVFESDVNLMDLINSYAPKDEKDDEKFYGHTDDEEEEDMETLAYPVGEDGEEESQDCKDIDLHSQDSKEALRSKLTDQPAIENNGIDLPGLPLSIQSPIISDVLSLYNKEADKVNGVDHDFDDDVVDITDDVDDVNSTLLTVVVIDDDD